MIKNYKNKIKELNAELEMFKSVKYLHNYFYPIRFSRETYIVEMRKIVALKLFEQGFKQIDIASILGKDHATIFYGLTIVNSPSVIESTLMYEQWIESKLYPSSIYIKESSYFHTNGVSSVLSFQLVELKEFIAIYEKRQLDNKQKQIV